MPTLTRGPLPARVYWVRRIMVLGTAILLVIAIGRLLGDGSDGASGADDQASPVAAGTTSSGSSVGASSAAPTTGPTKKPRKKRSQAPTPTLAVPVGECADSDIAVTPVVEEAVGGRDVRIVVKLRTLESPACTWSVGPDVLTMNITSGQDDIWSSRQCPGAIPKESVVVRQAVYSQIEVIWKEARRSDQGCTKLTDWAYPGWYHVTAAALGGEPSDVQFELTTPTAATITRTAKPKQTPATGPSANPSGKPTQRSTGRPLTTPSPSGAVEPDLGG